MEEEGRAVRDSGEAQKQGAQTDTQTREWKTGRGSQLVERRRMRWETRAPPAIRLLCPRTGQGCLSGSSPPCSLGLVRSLGPTEECQRAKAPEQMRV